MEDKIPDELGETVEARQFRLKRMSELDNPCPKCHIKMKYIQDETSEGWRCDVCKTWTPMGGMEDGASNTAKIPPRVQAPKDKLQQYVSKYKKGKGGGPRAGCSSC